MAEKMAVLLRVAAELIMEMIKNESAKACISQLSPSCHCLFSTTKCD